MDGPKVRISVSFNHNLKKSKRFNGDELHYLQLPLWS